VKEIQKAVQCLRHALEVYPGVTYD
jgi:hypothetical protein